jgi:hypothetical protein
MSISIHGDCIRWDYQNFSSKTIYPAHRRPNTHQFSKSRSTQNGYQQPNIVRFVLGYKNISETRDNGPATIAKVADCRIAHEWRA